MLPQLNRMRKAGQFGPVLREGKRAGNDLMVVHYLADQSEQQIPLVGFIVSKHCLPHAVDRNRFRRQLRAIIRAQLDEIPAGARIIVRAQKQARGKSSAELESAFRNGLGRAIRKARQSNK